MAHEDHGGKQDQLEEHSLPGTNQAGKGPGACEEDDQEPRGGNVQDPGVDAEADHEHVDGKTTG